MLVSDAKRKWEVAHLGLNVAVCLSLRVVRRVAVELRVRVRRGALVEPCWGEEHREHYRDLLDWVGGEHELR